MEDGPLTTTGLLSPSITPLYAMPLLSINCGTISTTTDGAEPPSCIPKPADVRQVFFISASKGKEPLQAKYRLCQVLPA